MKLHLKNIVPVLVIFLLVNLACNFPTGNVNLQEQIATPTPPVQLEGEGESGFSQDPSTGRVTIIITEHDLTSFISAEMDAQENPPLRNLQVLLRDGQVEVTGQAQTGPFLSDVRLVAIVAISTDGTPIFEITSADLGPFPVPSQMRDQLSTQANDVFTRSIASQIHGYRAERIDIDAGRITITAVTQ